MDIELVDQQETPFARNTPPPQGWSQRHSAWLQISLFWSVLIFVLQWQWLAPGALTDGRGCVVDQQQMFIGRLFEMLQCAPPEAWVYVVIIVFGVATNLSLLALLAWFNMRGWHRRYPQHYDLPLAVCANMTLLVGVGYPLFEAAPYAVAFLIYLCVGLGHYVGVGLGFW